MYKITIELNDINCEPVTHDEFPFTEEGADVVALKKRAFAVAQSLLQLLGYTEGTAGLTATLEIDGQWFDTDEFEIKLTDKSPWKTLNLTMFCQACYNSSLQVPADCSIEEAIEYAKAYIDCIPVNKGHIEYVPYSDVLDEENCDFEEDA